MIKRFQSVIVYSGPEPTCTIRALGRAEEVFELTVTDDDLFTASDTVVIINKLLKDLLDQTRRIERRVSYLPAFLPSPLRLCDCCRLRT